MSFPDPPKELLEDSISPRKVQKWVSEFPKFSDSKFWLEKILTWQFLVHLSRVPQTGTTDRLVNGRLRLGIPYLFNKIFFSIYYQAVLGFKKVKLINLDWERSTHKRRNLIIRLSWQTEKIGKWIQNGKEIHSKFQRTRRRYCSYKGKISLCSIPHLPPSPHIYPQFGPKPLK